MLFYGISLIMKEKSNASALTWEQAQVCLVPDAFVSRPRCVRVSTQMRLCIDPRSLRVIIYFY